MDCGYIDTLVLAGEYVDPSFYFYGIAAASIYAYVASGKHFEIYDCW